MMMIVRGGLRKAIEHERQLSRGDGGVPQHSLPKFLRRRDFRRRCRRVRVCCCIDIVSGGNVCRETQTGGDATG